VNSEAPDRTSVPMSAALLLVGQLLYILITQMHAGGDANDHPAIFAAYARSGIWTAVHVGQFAATAILIAGLFALSSTLGAQAGASRWAARFSAGSAAVALALYGVVMAVDGVALKQAVNAWASAPDAEKATRFATAESIRWIEWGARSYQNLALGLALLLLAAAVGRTAWLPRPIAYLMGLSGLFYLAQGWVAGTDGFTRTHDVLIVLAWVLNLAWMIWLAIVARRSQDLVPATPGSDGADRRDA
jgi:hypothetical protein